MDHAAAPRHRLCALLRPIPCVAGEIAALLTRLALAQVFIQAGWGKLTDHATPTQSFTDLHIPLPGLNAWIVAIVEFVGGILIAFGLGTRVAAFLQACTMVVALVTAHRGQIIPGLTMSGAEHTNDITDILVVPLLIFQLWLIKNGAGTLSLDRLIAFVRGRRRADEPMPAPR